MTVYSNLTINVRINILWIEIEIYIHLCLLTDVYSQQLLFLADENLGQTADAITGDLVGQCMLGIYRCMY